MTNEKNALREEELAAVSGGNVGGVCGNNSSGNGGGVYVSGDYPCGNGGAFIGGVCGENISGGIGSCNNPPAVSGSVVPACNLNLSSVLFASAENSKD